MIKPDPTEIKDLSLKFVNVCRSHFKPCDGNRDEIARQMLTSVMTMAYTIEIIKGQAAAMGIHLRATAEEIIPQTKGTH